MTRSDEDRIGDILAAAALAQRIADEGEDAFYDDWKNLSLRVFVGWGCWTRAAAPRRLQGSEANPGVQRFDGSFAGCSRRSSATDLGSPDRAKRSKTSDADSGGRSSTAGCRTHAS